MTVAKGTFKGSIVVKDGKIAEVGEKVMVPAGRQGHRRRQPVRDPRHHRLPLAHRRRWRHQRGQRLASPRWSISRTSSTPRTSPSTARWPAASPRPTFCTAPPTPSAARRCRIKMRWGKDAAGHDLRRRHARHQVRARRESQARRQPHRRRGVNADAGALSRHPHGRGGRDPRGLQRRQSLQGRVGRLRRQEGTRRACHSAAQRPADGGAQGSARRQALRPRRTATAPTKS